MDHDIDEESRSSQPSVHRVPSPKRYAAEDSEGRPAALLSYKFRDRLNRMFPHALTERGLCIACTSRVDGIIWSPAGPIGCSICGYQFPNPLDLSQDERSFDYDERILGSQQGSESEGERSSDRASLSVASGLQEPACDVTQGRANSSVASGLQEPACDAAQGSEGEAFPCQLDPIARGLESISRAEGHARRAESLVCAMSQYARDMTLSASGRQASACGAVNLSVSPSDVQTDEDNNFLNASDSSLSASGRQATACGVNSLPPSCQSP